MTSEKTAEKGSSSFQATKSTKAARKQDKVATVILACLVGAIMLGLVVIIVFIVGSGAYKLFDAHFLTAKPEQFKAGGGIGPEIFNSFYLLVLTLLISLPLSLGAAIFLTQYAPEGRFTNIAKTAIETLSSLPSIVVGLFGMLVFVLQFGWGFSILSGALALTMFNIPILVRVIQQALEAVPREQRDAALALGLTRWEATVHILIPAAMPAIVTGVILSAGRVFGEAAALIYTAGQSAPALDWSAPITSLSNPLNIFRPAETLAVHIWKINSEGVVPDLAAVSAGTAAVLMVSVLAFNIIARIVGRVMERKMTAE
ncbi:MAG: phosphate ABC transporter permease PstA [Tractidigestivibacter sp.]|jgi:phosphate transport system permease protein|uniref:phosphate ABC transporter permease PstA n=1 Tax=Tractidigestivibacter sp. TaxID=2847320 RepID=UPI003D8B9811